MQDPDEDTEWNDILRAKGVLPPKAKPAQEENEELVDKDFDDLTLDELMDDFEADAEDSRALQEYRRKRMEEITREAERANKFGTLLDITRKDYTREINDAGAGIWVVLVLYKPEIVVCRRLLQIVEQLAAKFPSTKFIRSISTSCIPNYPDHNLPSVLIYFENDVKKQWIGPGNFGGERMQLKDVEVALAGCGAISKSTQADTGDDDDEDLDFGDDPRKQTASIRGVVRKSGATSDESDDD